MTVFSMKLNLLTCCLIWCLFEVISLSWTTIPPREQNGSLLEIRWEHKVRWKNQFDAGNQCN